jgi:NADPH:quinone reductase-like Zn-dependent oxidoreductase
MRALRLDEDGLRVERLAVPIPAVGEVLVRVYAAAITRDELTWPTERLPAIPSFELSGVVAEIGPGVGDLAAGDEVFALTPFDRDGVAADYAAVAVSVLAPRPCALTRVECAALPLPGLSAWQGLFDHGQLAEGERVRVLGQSGGVGHLAVQLAGGQLAGEGEPCELIFDTVGGDALAAAVGLGPRVVSVAEEAEGVSFFVVEPNREQLLELAGRADTGELRPEIDSVFKLEDALAAFARVSERGKHGKVVLQVADE